MSIETLISNAQDYAGVVLADARTALTAADSLVRTVGYSVPGYYPASLPSAPPSALTTTVPTLDQIQLNLPNDPGAAPNFQDISEITTGSAPTAPTDAPTFEMPTKPSQVAEFQAAAPSINTSLAFPEPPGVLMNPLINAPVLTDRVEPAAPQVSLPVFAALSPTDNTVAPTNLEGQLASSYASASPSMVTAVNGYVDAMLAKHNPRYHEQMARIEAQLATYLDGGTGINPAVENAIYERSRSKQDAEARRARDGAYGEAAARGFSLPPGSAMAAMRQSRQSAADNNAQSAREIVVMQAEMEQKNLQFAVTTSAGLREALLSASLSYMQNLVSINGQALDYAKSILGAVVESYNIAAKVFGVKLEAYKAEAVVYETRLKSAMAGIELYTQEIKALEALTNVDRAKVDVYRARIESLRAYSDVYKAQIDAVIGRVSLEKLKLDVYQSQVQAFTARVQAKNAEWQGYSAALGGETAKAQVFQARMAGYSAEVQGYKAEIEAKSEVVRAKAITNDARAKQYSAALSGYSAVVTARGEVARTKLENQRQTILAFQAQVQAEVGNAQVQNEYYRATAMTAISNAELQMKAMVQGGANQQAFGNSIAQLGLHSAQIYSGLASSAMSGMNSLAGELKYE